MLVWHFERETFPSLMLLRRYLKLVAEYCAKVGLAERPLVEVADSTLPFALSALPYRYPPLSELRLWVLPRPE